MVPVPSPRGVVVALRAGGGRSCRSGPSRAGFEAAAGGPTGARPRPRSRRPASCGGSPVASRAGRTPRRGTALVPELRVRRVDLGHAPGRRPPFGGIRGQVGVVLPGEPPPGGLDRRGARPGSDAENSMGIAPDHPLIVGATLRARPSPHRPARRSRPRAAVRGRCDPARGRLLVRGRVPAPGGLPGAAPAPGDAGRRGPALRVAGDPVPGRPRCRPGSSRLAAVRPARGSSWCTAGIRTGPACSRTPASSTPPGFHTLLFDVRGHGENPPEVLPISGGRVRGRRARRPSRSCARRPEVTSVGLLGHSMGAVGPSSRRRAEPGVAALVATAMPGAPPPAHPADLRAGRPADPGPGRASARLADDCASTCAARALARVASTPLRGDPPLSRARSCVVHGSARRDRAPPPPARARWRGRRGRAGRSRRPSSS